MLWVLCFGGRKIEFWKRSWRRGIKRALLDFNRTKVHIEINSGIIENLLNKTHPMSFGLGDKYFSLKQMTGIIHWKSNKCCLCYKRV
jgi:hypothetical protein